MGVSPGPDTLVVSESWMPGWKAEVNGELAEVIPYEDALLAMKVPAGNVTVRFRRIRDRCDPEPRIHYLDLGADAVLAGLPFSDGHHRDYPVARRGTARIVELLRPLLPQSLWQE